MKDYIEERVLELAHYIITTNSTVRAAARKFRVSKSTVHKGSLGLIISCCLCKAHAAKHHRKADGKDQQQAEPCSLWFIH